MNKERAREQLEDAVHQAIEAGMTEREITEEVEYALHNHEDLDEES
jgi:Xaa-Pro aminopeptidase